MKLWNIHPHSQPGRCIEAIDLLHFCADSVADWECDLKNCNHNCPWWYEITKITETGNIEIKKCILDAIKDLGYEMLDPEPEEEIECD